MPRRATGSVIFSRGRWYAQITLGVGPVKRPAFALPTCKTEEEARARLAVLVDLAAKLREAGHIDLAPDILERAAAAKDDRALAVVRRSVQIVIERGARSAAPGSETTLQTFGERWTRSELARLYPAHLKVKRSAHTDAGRLERHVYPVVGGVPLVGFTLDHALEVLATIPEERSDATRRHVAQVLHRLLSIAVFPARLIPSNPLPKGFLPKLEAGKAKGYLYPDEDARLLA